MNLFHVAPFDQNLSIGGRDLLDNEATLESLRIYPHSVILLKVSHFILLISVNHLSFYIIRVSWMAGWGEG
jgi:hypothetical protein